MRITSLVFLTLAIIPVVSEAQLLGAENSTNVVLISEVRTENAWRRDVVMVDGEGNIIGDGGVVGEKASTVAIDEAASNAYHISVAAKDAMDLSMQKLYTATQHMAQSCVGFAIAIAPESVRSNLTSFVVKSESNGYTDTQWVWYNRSIAMKPIRYVRYSRYDLEENVKCEWQNWTTNGVTITHNGRTWNGVHVCTVQRPLFAVGWPCVDLPNETLGGDNGIDFGDMVLRRNGVDYYTGFVTNGITHEVIYFDNGFMKPLPQ